MKSRRFIIYALIYVVAVTLGTYSLYPGDAVVGAFGYDYTLPIAAWVGGVVALLAIFASIHMMYYGFLAYLRERALKKDIASYKELAKDVLLDFKSEREFRTDTFELAREFSCYLSPWGAKSELLLDDELRQISQHIEQVKAGEIVDLKRYRLPLQNPLNLKNELNKIEGLANYYLDILKNEANYPESLTAAAYAKLIAQGEYANVKKYALNRLKPVDALSLLERFGRGELELKPEEIFELANNEAFSTKEFISIAMALEGSVAPDAYFGLFSRLRQQHPQADRAYLYVLFELGMIEEAREIIQNSLNDEFADLKPLLFLRENGKSVASCLFFK